MARSQDKTNSRTALVVSVLALVVALTGTGANAAKQWITGRQIKDGTITSRDIRDGTIRPRDLARNSVNARALARGAVKTANLAKAAVTATAIAPGSVSGLSIEDRSIESDDIGDGEVGPDEISVPDPVQIQVPADHYPLVPAGEQYTLAAVVGVYRKQEASTSLQVSWAGAGTSHGAACVFQLRVDGRPAEQAAGEVYINGAASVSSTALFDRLAIGDHTIEVWARMVSIGIGCRVGTWVGQTFVIAEQLTS